MLTQPSLKRIPDIIKLAIREDILLDPNNLPIQGNLHQIFTRSWGNLYTYRSYLHLARLVVFLSKYEGTEGLIFTVFTSESATPEYSNTPVVIWSWETGGPRRNSLLCKLNVAMTDLLFSASQDERRAAGKYFAAVSKFNQ